MKKIIVLLLCVCCSVFLFACSNQESEINYTTYNMQILYNNEDKTLEATEKVEYVNNTQDTLEMVCFHLYPSAFRSGSKQSVISLLSHSLCYYNGTSYGSIEIKSVKINDKSANFQICGEDENILKVELNEKLSPNKSVFINIDFSVCIPNINHRFGYGKNAINIANFYPIACVYENGQFLTNPYHSNGDPFYSQMANYDVSISYPANFILANTGQITQSNEVARTITTKDNKQVSMQYKTAQVNIDKVRDFAFVLSEKFNEIKANENGTEIKYYYYQDENPQKSLQTAVDSIKTFNNLFGIYPYSTLSVVQTNFVHGGMEYPNLVYISDSVTDYADYQNVIIHEIAHQWWYNLVGSNAFANGWQDEGLTDYSTALFYEVNPSYNKTLDNVILNGIRNYSFFVDVYSSVYGKLDTSMTRALNEYPTDPEYVYIAYVKSMLMFDSLRGLIGDKDFFESLKVYFQTYCFKEASPRQMIECFEKTSNKNLESFFASWLEGKVLIVAVG